MQRAEGKGKVQAILGEKPVIKVAWICSYQNQWSIILAPSFLQLLQQIRQCLKDGVEIIGGKVIEAHPKLRQSLPELSAQALHTSHQHFDVTQCVET